MAKTPAKKTAAKKAPVGKKPIAKATPKPKKEKVAVVAETTVAKTESKPVATSGGIGKEPPSM